MKSRKFSSPRLVARRRRPYGEKSKNFHSSLIVFVGDLKATCSHSRSLVETGSRPIGKSFEESASRLMEMKKKFILFFFVSSINFLTFDVFRPRGDLFPRHPIVSRSINLSMCASQLTWGGEKSVNGRSSSFIRFIHDFWANNKLFLSFPLALFCRFVHAI